jgi:hypothetical protein
MIVFCTTTESKKENRAVGNDNAVSVKSTQIMNTMS